MKTIKRLDVLSVAKLHGAVLALFALIVGLVFTLFAGLFGSLVDAPGFGIVSGLGMTIGGVVLYGIMGFISGAVGAFFYNVVAKKIGGIKIELE